MEEEQFIATAALICEPSRARILWKLLDGRAYTASELAIAADLSITAVSNHLSKLLSGQVLKVDAQGRHRYFSFAGKEIAYAVEALAHLSQHQHKEGMSIALNKSDVKYCRTCYDHLAGKVGVLLTEKLVSRHIIELKDKDFVLTAEGFEFFTGLGINPSDLQGKRRQFAKPCLDWSERKYHLAGSLGAAILEVMIQKDWVRKTKNSRNIIITSMGEKAIKEVFHLEL